VPHHETLIPHLMTHVGSGGALGFQVPANIDAPAHRLMRELGASPKWLPYFPRAVREWQVEGASAYYDFLAPISARVDLWYTDYLHVLPNAEAIVEWYRGTGLRPWLEALPDETTRADFLRDYLKEITDAFPPQANGRVLFPFRRLFVIAYR
jgi:trans-aconitate 2-methyltransferase